jgi:hypothetical protein
MRSNGQTVPFACNRQENGTSQFALCANLSPSNDFETEGVDMRKLAIGITAAVELMLIGILAWNADATPLTGSTTVRPGTNYSLVEKAGCKLLPGHCGVGKHKVCDRFSHACKCVPCPG